MEPMDRAIDIWHQSSPNAFRRALEENPQPCPVCENKADVVHLKIRNNGTVDVPCVCSVARQARALYDWCQTANQLHPRDKLVRLEQLKRWGGQQHWDSFAAAGMAIKRLIESPLQHKWITMIGGRGCGKTHLMLGAFNSIPGYAVYYYCAALADAAFSSLDGNTTVELKDKLIRIPVLLLDDLGTEPAGSDFVRQFINAVIGERYHRRQWAPTVITTNLSVEQLYQRYDRMADRILDVDLVERYIITLGSYRARTEEANGKGKAK